MDPITVEVLLDGPLTVEVLTTGAVSVDVFTDEAVTVDVSLSQDALVTVEVLNDGVLTAEINIPEDVPVVEVAIPGLPGPRGPSGDVTTVEMTAVGAVSALRVITVDSPGMGRYASPSILSDAGSTIGLSITAAADGGTFDVQSSGPLDDVSWSFVPGPVFCGSDGVLTQVVPPTGWVLEVARAVDSTQIIVGVQTPLLRS